MARLVFPGIPHHVTQRGNGGAQTFFSDADHGLYRDLLAEHASAAGVEVWAGVLMPNHVHLIQLPRDEDGSRRTLAPGRRWSSVHAHLEGREDGLTAIAPICSRWPDFAGLLAAGEDEALSQRLRRAETIRRPIGSEAFLHQLQQATGRAFAPRNRGTEPMFPFLW